MYNKTEFYAIDEDAVNDLTEDSLQTWIQNGLDKTNSYKADFFYRDDNDAMCRLDDVTVAEKNGYYVVTGENGDQITKVKIGTKDAHVIKEGSIGYNINHGIKYQSRSDSDYLSAVERGDMDTVCLNHKTGLSHLLRQP